MDSDRNQTPGRRLGAWGCGNLISGLIFRLFLVQCDRANLVVLLNVPEHLKDLEGEEKRGLSKDMIR